MKTTPIVEMPQLFPSSSESLFKKSAEEILKLNGFTRNLPNIRFNQSIRKMGYNSLSACADIVDNSIDAGATEVKVNIIYNNGNFEAIQFIDNGYGMSLDDLDQALRLGSDSQKDFKDLGAFGCGLKTASLSQGKKVSVISKSNDEDYVYSSQDLELMISANDWIKELRKANKDEIQNFIKLVGLKTGTLVEISNLDLIDYTYLKPLESNLIKHFGVIYKKFIRSRKITISVNGKKVEAFDSVHDNEPSVLTEENIDFKGSQITLKLYELHDYGQHINKDRGIGHDLQGFHVFRNNREIMDGQTLGLFSKHPKYNFFRGEIFFDGNLDNYFYTDIKKSSIQLKQDIKDKLRSICNAYLNLQARKHNSKNAKDKTDQINFDPLKKLIEDKLNLIQTPKVDIEKRKSPSLNEEAKEKSPNSDSERTRNPRNNKKPGFVNKFDFKFVPLGGSYGPIWQPNMEGRKVIVELNQEHPFIVENILPLYENGGIDAFNAVMVLLMAMSNYELKLSQQTENFDAFVKMRSEVGSEVVTILN